MNNAEIEIIKQIFGSTNGIISMRPTKMPISPRQKRIWAAAQRLVSIGVAYIEFPKDNNGMHYISAWNYQPKSTGTGQ